MKVKQISSSEVFKDLGKKHIIVVDVRMPQEFSKGHIKGSINLPLDNLKNQINEVVKDKNTIIYLYCLSGARSNIAVGILNELGYTNAYSMVSGLLSWRAEKFPLFEF